MPKKTDQSEYDEIFNTVALFPGGAAFDQIFQVLTERVQPRSLHRRLVILIEQGRIVKKGNSRSTRYQIVPVAKEADHILPRGGEDGSNDNVISLSEVAKAIQIKVQQPMQSRNPVGYNRAFLDQYRPNETTYLPKPILKHLFALGKTDGERPAGTYARQIYNRLLIDLTWNSSRLEGNTYSLLETERLLNVSEIVKGKDLKEARMILNHKDAIEFLVDSAQEIGINRYIIFNLHALLSNDLLSELEACGVCEG